MFEEAWSTTERFDHEARGSGAGILLLAGDQKTVANGELSERLIHHEIGTGDPARFLFDPERLDPHTDQLIGLASDDRGAIGSCLRSYVPFLDIMN